MHSKNGTNLKLSPPLLSNVFRVLGKELSRRERQRIHLDAVARSHVQVQLSEAFVPTQ